MMKKRLSKTLWYGSDIDKEGKPVLPPLAEEANDLEGIHEGELYLHLGDGSALLFTRSADGQVVQLGINADELANYLLKSVWDKAFEIRTTENGEEYLFTKLNLATQYGITMYANGGILDLPNIFKGLPIDNDTIYWDGEVLKSRGVGEGGVTPTLLGDLKNVGSWANVIATEDRIMVQKKDSSSWEALELSKVGGSADFSNVKESGEGNAFTSFVLSEDKKTLTFVKGKNFAEKSDTLSGYGIKDAYTKTEADSLLEKKWTQDNNKIANWDTAFGWGDHSKAGYASKSTTLAGYGITNAYTKAEANRLLGEKADLGTTLADYGITNAYTSEEVDELLGNYLPLSGGIIADDLRLRKGDEYTSPYLYFGDRDEVWLKEVNDTHLTIHADGTVIIDADLIVKGGITMYANEGDYTPSTIMDAVSVDNQTIIKQGGKLMVNPELVFGSGGGGEVSTVVWGNIIGKPTWITDTKPVYKYAEISGTPDLSVYAPIESLDNYQSKITTTNKLSYSLIDGTPNLSVYALKSDLNGYQIKITESNKLAYSLIDDTPDLSVYATKGTSLSHYGITDAYTKTNVDSLLSAKWTKNDTKISNWDTAYSWGNHAQAGYFKSADFTKNKIKTTLGISDWALASTKPSYTTKEVAEDTNLYFTNARAVSALTETLKGYVTLSGTQTISGEKNFTGGLKVNGSPIVYNATGKYWKLEGDLLVTGGITMFGSDSSFNPSTITQAVNIDGSTLVRKNGVIMLNPDIEFGGGSDIDLSEYAKKATTLAGYGIADAYTKTEVNNNFIAKATKDFMKVNGSLTSNVDFNDYYTSGSYNNTTGNGSGNSNTPGGYGLMLVFGDKSGYAAQLHVNAGSTSAKIRTRYVHSGNVFTWSDWNSLAYTTSNVESATRLETPRSIWGQLFDGSADINNTDITLYQNESSYTGGWARAILSRNSSGDVLGEIGFFGLGESLSYTYLGGRYSSPRIAILANGKIGVGTTTPQYEFDVNGSTRIQGTSIVRSVRPELNNSYELGDLSYLWANIYTKKANIDGIEIKKSANGVLYIGGNLVVSGGVTMYGTDGTTANTIWDSAPIASTSVKGIASFDSNYFAVNNGKVTFVGQTGGGVADSVAWGNVTGKPTWIGSNKPSYTTSEVAEGTNLYFTNARAVSALSSTLSNYLPLSGGGTINGMITIKPTNIAGVQDGIVLHDGGYGSGESLKIKWTSESYKTGLSLCVQQNNGSLLFENSDGFNTVWHSGNDGELRKNVLKFAYSKYTNGSYRDANYLDGGILINYNTPGEWKNTPSGMSYGAILDISYDLSRDLTGQLAWDVNQKMWFRMRKSSDWTSWREMAFTDSDITGNAASSDRLKTARTLWGNSFNGGSDIKNADITLYQNESSYTGGWARAILSRNSSGDVLGEIGFFGLGESLSYTYLGGRHSSPRIVILADGKVGVGTTTPQYEFDVNGSTRIQGTSVVKSVRPELTNSYSLGDSSYLWANIYTKKANIDGIEIKKSANGVLYIGGNLVVSGGVTMYSDLRKKTILNHVELSLKEVADAPLIEHYYNSDEKKTTHVGSIAQYWAGLNDWFCKEDEEGFLTMEIQNAALASAISVARELTRYESKTDKQIKKLKKRIGELEEEIENLKKM